MKPSRSDLERSDTRVKVVVWEFQLNPDDVLLILVEIRFRLGSQVDSPICDNEPIWKMWDPQIPFRLCEANESDVRVAQEQINRLKANVAA